MSLKTTFQIWQTGSVKDVGFSLIRAVILTLSAIFVASSAHGASKSTTAASLSSGNAPRDVSVIIAGSAHVQDTTLRSGLYWGKWNFGNSQFLQVGFQPSTVYDTYHTVSLIRFDLAGLKYLKVDSAKLRLYFPRNLIQQTPVPVHIYAVSQANGGWMAGSSEAEEQPDACSWENISKDHPWIGASGLSKPGIGYRAEALDTKMVDGLDGEWVEFKLPEQLAQSWMDSPDKNSGLLIKTDDNAAVGQGTYIYSSEHWSGKGPQLVLTGEALDRLVPTSIFAKVHHNSIFQLPPMGPVYYRWLQESPSRYAVWAQDKSINLNGVQALYPYLWDIVYRAEIILPKAMLPLSKETEEIPSVIRSGDKVRARQIMEDFMKYMMVFDYARDQNWYDSGPTADVLSPLQVAQFFVKSEENASANAVHGIYSQYDDGRWPEDAPDSDGMEAAIQAQLKTVRERLKPTPDQYAKIEATVRQNMPLEKLHARELKKSLDTVRALIQRRVDGIEMLQALRGMFFHHRMFLIHQSLFSMPKYSALMENGDILAYAQWFYEVRHGQYSQGRVGRQLAAATRYMWKPSQHLEAEYASFQHCEWSDIFPGYSGTGYVLFDAKSPGSVDWQTDVSSAGAYRLTFRYLLPDAPGRALQVSVNNVPLVSPVSFAQTPSNMWSIASVIVKLHPGQNIICVLNTANGGPALDYLDVEPIRLVASEQIAPSLIDSNAVAKPEIPAVMR